MRSVFVFPDLEREANFDSDDGRAMRSKVLAAIVVVLIVAGAAFVVFREWGNADRLATLEADLHESFDGMDRSDLPFVAPDHVLSTTRLTTNGGVEPNLVSVDGDTIHALYGYDFLGEHTCVRVSWSSDDVAFERGEGTQCTGVLLN